MPTLKQKNLAKKTVENFTRLHELEKGELVEMGGYGKSAQKTPEKALGSKGYKEELANYGLTEELITTALTEDINSKKGKRLDELKFGAELLGMTKKAPQNAFQFNFNEDKEKYS